MKVQLEGLVGKGVGTEYVLCGKSQVYSRLSQYYPQCSILREVQGGAKVG